MVHDDEPIAKRVGFIEVMRGEEHCRASLPNRVDVLPKIYAILGIEPCGGFIEKENVWLVNEPESNVETTALSAGVRDHAAVGELGKVENSRELFGSAADGIEVSAVQPSLEDEVFPTGGPLVRAT